ncbi:MAG: twin-arginine translocation signal domain-containing protein [Chloroflexi bacterium]|nr:twin-arginine translocation signal domain-containing protein [Chloroflexota bacterium]
MATVQEEQQVSRRGFLKVAAVTAVAATTAGAGVAVIKQTNQPTVTTTITAPPTPAAATAISPVSQSNAAASDMFARLTSAQAENMRLQAALDATNRQLTALQQHDANALTSNEAMQLELAQSNEQLTILAGLISLYEQLEQVDLDVVLDEGFTAVSGAVTNLLDDIPTLEEGVEAGKVALAQVEDHLPVLENGRAWLDSHTGKLDIYFQSIENLLQETLKATASFLQMLNDWFEGIKKWLPFGIGRSATNIMQSITTLLLETPATVSGLNTNIAQPLNVWLAKDEQNEAALQKTLIKPLREDVLEKTGSTFAKARTLESTYAMNLKEPVETAVTNQKTVRGLITAYREEHRI